jgi:3-methyladenine DNA glycosylase AlkD
MKECHCKEVARLVSEGQDRRLSLLDRLHVRYHMIMCAVCRRFANQMKFVHRLAQRMGEPESVDTFDRSLSPEARSRIESRLKDMT